jgi:hypothetical protein
LGSHFKGEGSCKKNEIAFLLPPILKREVGREENKFHPFQRNGFLVHPF